MRRKYILILLSIFIVIYGYKVTLNIIHDNKEKLLASVKQDIDYTESLEEFDNPERGFYQYYYYNLKESNNDIINPDELSSNLMHLRIGLGSFSKAYNKDDDKELSTEALNKIDEILKTVKSKGGSSIIRFSYDNFEGKEHMEPTIEMIRKHIEQIGPILTQNKDSISYIELGLFGPWGEMHTSRLCTVENVSLALNKFLEVTPYELTIGVRTPEYYAGWAKVTRSSLNVNVTKEGSKEYRVGIYNDGYLGSSTDLGTYANRSIEIAWLKNQATHTFFGGEVVANSSSEPINTSYYLINEAFKTHTTYLNKDWNKTVIDSWKNQIYTGNESLYKEQTGYTYISNHLGYRFVVRNSSFPSNLTINDKLNINLSIENVGFANLINSKVVSIVLSNGSNIYEIKTDIDARKWLSQTTSDLKFNVELPSNLSLDSYNVYLRVSKYGSITNDNHYQTIRFANNNMWDDNIKANYIGKFNLVEKIDDTIIEDQIKEEENEETKKEEIIEDNQDNNDNIENNDNINNEQLDDNNSNNKKNKKVFIIIFILIGLGILSCLIYLFKPRKKEV